MQEHTFTPISSEARLLLMSEAITSNVAFVVDKMIGLRKLDEMNLRVEAAEESLCFKTQTYLDGENRIWHMLDCDKLVRSKEFATPNVV
jgi:twitching motility protein PilI